MGGPSGGPMQKGDSPGSYTDANGNPINTSGAPVGANGNPGIVPPQASTYQPQSPYTSPTYALTPQSGYTGLAQQLQQAMSLSPQAYAAPRTGLLTQFASPWSALYGGPASPTFAQLWGQPANMGTAPPPGTPGFLGQGNGNTPLPPPPAPPSTTPTDGGATSAPPSGTPQYPPGLPPVDPSRGAGGGLTKAGGGWNPQMASVNNTRAQYAGLPAAMTAAQMALPGRQGVRDWLAQVDPQRLADQFGYVRGAHGATPAGFKGTNAYKG